MENTDSERGKVDIAEDNRIDSGIESFKSINKDDQYIKATQEPNVTDTERENKLDCISDDRLDSAYGSPSLPCSIESLNGLTKNWSITDTHGAKSTDATEYNEEEVTVLTTITEDGDTVLHLTIIHEESDLAQQLIDLFPKDVLDIQNNLYQTPLHLATYLNLPAVVQSLVQKRASLELQDQEGNTPLHVACEHGRGECASELTKEIPTTQLSALLKIQNWRGLTCLHLAALRRNHRLIKLLMKKGADLNVQEGTSGKTPLHLAVELHDVPSVTLLLNKGANVDAVMFNGCTPLHLAVGRQDFSIAQLLCRSGADKMLRNMEDETALDLADGNDDILALFPFDDIQISGISVVGVQF